MCFPPRRLELRRRDRPGIPKPRRSIGRGTPIFHRHAHTKLQGKEIRVQYMFSRWRPNLRSSQHEKPSFVLKTRRGMQAQQTQSRFEPVAKIRFSPHSKTNVFNRADDFRFFPICCALETPKGWGQYGSKAGHGLTVRSGLGHQRPFTACPLHGRFTTDSGRTCCSATTAAQGHQLSLGVGPICE